MLEEKEKMEVLRSMQNLGADTQYSPPVLLPLPEAALNLGRKIKTSSNTSTTKQPMALPPALPSSYSSSFPLPPPPPSSTVPKM